MPDDYIRDPEIFGTYLPEFHIRFRPPMMIRMDLSSFWYDILPLRFTANCVSIDSF